MTSRLTRLEAWTRAAVSLAVGAMAVTGYALFVPYGLAWNLTDSIPRGLYFSEVLDAGDAVARGDIVCLQYVAPAWATQRQYGAPKLRMCKPVRGLPGDTLEQQADVLRVSSPAGSMLEVQLLSHDSRGRPLPQDTNQPGVLAAGKLFLLSTSSSRSLDSRYLGPVARASVTHRVYPLFLLKK